MKFLGHVQTVLSSINEEKNLLWDFVFHSIDELLLQSLGSSVELCDQKVLINFFSSKRKLDTLEVHETEY